VGCVGKKFEKIGPVKAFAAKRLLACPEFGVIPAMRRRGETAAGPTVDVAF
jgi:hypothetical protein